MKTRTLGGLEVSAIGLGCMGMSEFYGAHDEQQSLQTLDHALALGVNFWDTADIYGPFTNERLLAKALDGRRNEVVLATKFGIERNERGELLGLNGRPDYVQQACDASLQRLQVDHIDLYYLHRVDPATPIEETVGAMSRLVEQGKVRYLGLSEVGAETLQRAHQVHPIAALQSEYSLWSRDIEPEVIPICRKLGVGLVPYSPLGRGFLTGKIKSIDDLDENDYRLTTPRFSPENFSKNLVLVEQVKELAANKGCTPAQLAIAWVMSRGDNIVPIPGTRSASRLAENTAAAQVMLHVNELSMIQSVMADIEIAGTRYDERGMSLTNA